MNYDYKEFDWTEFNIFLSEADNYHLQLMEIEVNKRLSERGLDSLVIRN